MATCAASHAGPIRDRLPEDGQLRHFAVRREAVELRMSAVDLETAIAALPARKLTGDERADADLADLRVARDEAYQNGYPATAGRLDTAVAGGGASLDGPQSRPRRPRHPGREAAHRRCRPARPWPWRGIRLYRG